MHFAPFERIFHEVDSLRRTRRRGGGAAPSFAEVANIAHLGWTRGERPVREFSLPSEVGAEAIVDAALEVWRPTHRALLRESDPATTSREVWEARLAESVGEIWLIHTAGRIHRVPEVLMTYASQVLLDDLREAIVRRRVVEAQLTVRRGNRDAEAEGLAIVMTGYALVDGGGDRTGRDGANSIKDVLDVGTTSADSVTEKAFPGAKGDIARVESAWRTIWPIGLSEMRGNTKIAREDPVGSIDDRGEGEVETVSHIHALGIFGGVNGWQTNPAKLATASKLSHTVRGLRALHGMGVAESRAARTDKVHAELWERAGVGAVIGRLRASEETRQRTETVLERYARALDSWHGNLGRAQANPRWHPGEPVDLPSGLSRAELVAVMVHEYIRSDVPVGTVLEMVNRLAEEGTLTREARRDIHALTMAAAARHLARPAIERDPLGRADDSSDEKDSMRRQDLRDTLGGVEEATLIEQHRFSAKSHRELWQIVAAEVDKRLDRVSGAYPVVGDSDRDALGSAQKGGGNEAWNYAERVTLRHLGVAELWALHAYFTLRGDGTEVPIEGCPASNMYAQLGVGERQAGELRHVSASTGESLVELRDRIRHACAIANAAEPKSMSRPAEKKSSFAPRDEGSKPWAGGDRPKR